MDVHRCGAVWIWPQARQLLDYYHAVQHLPAVGRALFGEDATALRTRLKPLARQLKNESAVKVIRQLEQLQQHLRKGNSAAEVVRREVNYFHEHQDRMDYRAGRQRVQVPPVEFDCSRPKAGSGKAP